MFELIIFHIYNLFFIFFFDIGSGSYSALKPPHLFFDGALLYQQFLRDECPTAV